jgi:apolipoprotein N-acyltransferase
VPSRARPVSARRQASRAPGFGRRVSVAEAAGPASASAAPAAVPRPGPGLAVAFSALAGAAMLAAFPPYDLWWTAPIGVALLAAAVHRRRIRSALLLGGLAGLGLFVPLLSFTGLQVGWAPWFLLAGVQAGFLALLGAAAAATSILVDRRPWCWPVMTGVLWAGQEALRGRIPFGGFPWGRLAFSQGDAPTAQFAALGGAPMVTLAVAAAGGLLAAALWSQCWGWPRANRVGSRSTAAAGAAAVIVLLAGVLVPATPARGRSVVVAVVQGNVPRLGLDFNAQRRAVLDNHVNATLALADDVRAGRRPQPDVVIWPENSSDIDPYLNADAGGRITTAARAINAPILVGAALRGPKAGQLRNAGLVWNPDGRTSATYVKRHPVPFAEYVPLRPWVRRITTLVDQVRADFVPGAAPGVLSMGDITVGDVICFEVAYDGLVRDTVTAGAELLVVQTNNATFNTGQAEQQLAMVRLRAIEHGRPAVMASTVGISAVVDTDGTLRDASRFNTAAVLVRRTSLSPQTTVATRLGALPEIIFAFGALSAVVLALVASRQARPDDQR